MAMIWHHGQPRSHSSPFRLLQEREKLSCEGKVGDVIHSELQLEAVLKHHQAYNQLKQREGGQRLGVGWPALQRTLVSICGHAMTPALLMSMSRLRPESR